MAKIRTRFAPSPTGFVHVGNLYGAYLGYAHAKANQGKFILRIEDTDQKRGVEGAIGAIYKALNWFGIKIDEGPRQGGRHQPYIQSKRLHLYQNYAEKLIAKNKAYYCFCSPERLRDVRRQQKNSGKPPMYDRRCRDINLTEAQKRIDQGEKAVIRMKVPKDKTIIVNDLVRGSIKFDSNLIDDQVLLKSDGYPTYHLAVVVDDHLMNITHVVRGEEWLPSFPKHKLLYQYLEWKMPEFFHNPLFRNPDGSKMSKRQGDISVSWYRDQGFLPEALKNYISLMGWSHPDQKEIFSEEEFFKHFDLKDVDPVAPIFDLEKLEWMNGVYIRQKPDAELAELLRQFLPKMSVDEIKMAVPLIKDRIKRLSEAKDMLEFVWHCSDLRCQTMLQNKIDQTQAKLMLVSARRLINQIGIIDTEKLQKEMIAKIKAEGWKTGDFFMVLRVAVCSKRITPPILPALKLIGKEETLRRIDLAVERLSLNK